MEDVVPVIRPRSWSRGNERSRAPSTAAPSRASDILTALQRLVVGQQAALEELSLLLAMHALGRSGSRAPNAVILGPTGVGKTHALAVASRALGLPFATTDATLLVPSGIVGEQVEDVLEALVDAAGARLDASRVPRRRDDDLALAGRGILLIDEFDKIAAPDDDPSWRQAERRTIQRRLLKLAEGARLRVGVKRHDADSRERFLDTSGILLIAAGVFERHPGGMWLGHPSGSAARRITPSDIVGMGFMPELVGRFPVLIRYDALRVPDLVRLIDHDAVSPLGAWRQYFDAVFGATLRIDDAAKGLIAERALGLGLGARGLQHVLFPILSSMATELVGSRRSRDVVLRVSDVLSEIAGVSITSVPVASRLQ